MHEIKIAEIPIYGIDENSFNQKWENHIQKTVTEWVCSGWKKDEADTMYRRIVYPRSVWQYSQIIGFLTITLSTADISFEIYAPINERYLYNKTSKTYIQCWHTNGLHFPLPSPVDNCAITKEIYRWIEIIQQDFLKKYHLDLSTFNAISNHLNYKAIIDQLSITFQASQPSSN